MKKVLLLGLLCIATTLSAQEFSLDLLKDMKPRNIGPGGMSGRVTAIDVVVSNPDIMYVGTASGGLWKSTDFGATWITTTDDLPQIGVSGIAIDHSNSDIIYIATGDDDGNDSYSVGVMKSLDGGETWTWTALTRDSGADNLRPIIPSWKSDERIILWMRGAYHSYHDWNTQIVGIKTKRGEN